MFNFCLLWAACAAISAGYMHSKGFNKIAVPAVAASLIVTVFLNIIQLIIKLIIGFIL